MSIWQEHNVEDTVRDILSRSRRKAGQRGYLTVYQIAIAIRQNHPILFQRLNLPIGGKGTRAYSLSKYLSREYLIAF